MNVRPIPGFPGYEISDCGRVFSWLPRTWNAKPPKVAREKSARVKNGYLVVDLILNKKQYTRYIHRMVLETFVGLPSQGHEACHNDGNSMNNLLSNLRWDTRKANHADKKKHGTDDCGSKSVNSKLTEIEVIQMKKLYDNKIMNMKELSEKFCVAKSTVHKIIHKKMWKHV